MLRAVVTDKHLESYATGAMMAGYYFAQMNPDWKSRLTEMAAFSAAWPVTMTLDLIETIRNLF